MYAFISRLMYFIEEKSNGPFLVEVFEHGIWPSSERLALYQIFRERYENSETVHESPGHEGTLDEIRQVEACAFLCVCFGWGINIFGGGSSRWASVNHDGHVWVGAESDEAVVSILGTDAIKPKLDT
jgi:hypothetical protein